MIQCLVHKNQIIGSMKYQPELYEDFLHYYSIASSKHKFLRPLEEIQGAAKNLLCTTHVECSMYECQDIILTPNMSLFIPPWTQSLSPTLSNTMMTQKEHSVEEVLERPTGYPKVGGSNHSSVDFSLQPQRNPYLS